MAKKKTASWGSIFLWFIFFFPVSFYLIVNKLTTEKDKYFSNGKALKYMSYFCVFAAVYTTAGFLSGELKHDNGTPASFGSFVAMFIAMVSIAIFLFSKGTQFIARGRTYDRHLAGFSQECPVDIRQLSIDLKLPYKTTCSDLQYMIKSGYISNAYVDENLGSLIYRESIEEIPVETEMQVFVCPNCCGKNAVRSGSSVKCCYCDSTFEIE